MPLRVQAVTAILPDIDIPAPAGANPLPIVHIHQEQTNWCWAACCEMVFRLFGTTNVHQCDMATKQFHVNCCVAPASGQCNQGNWPEIVYPAYGFNCDRNDRVFSMDEVKAEINAGRPVEVYYSWNGGGAHVALVTGYFANGDLEVHDPWFGEARQTYSFILAAYNLGAWQITYSNLGK